MKLIHASLATLLWLSSSIPLLHAKDGAVQCAMLIYAGTKTSRCFSDEFLNSVQQKTSIATERRFKDVKLAGDELFTFPFVVMTGEGDFQLSQRERDNLRKYLLNGGFLLASAGCSNADWDRSFRGEMRQVFEEGGLEPIPQSHAIYRTVNAIEQLDLAKSSGTASLEGVEHQGKLVVLYSPQGLNDTSNTSGCCCCGGNEIQNSLEINVNILAYALLH